MGVGVAPGRREGGLARGAPATVGTAPGLVDIVRAEVVVGTAEERVTLVGGEGDEEIPLAGGEESGAVELGDRRAWGDGQQEAGRDRAAADDLPDAGERAESHVQGLRLFSRVPLPV